MLGKAFGWIPAHDLRHAFQQTGPVGAEQALTCLRRTAEINAFEALAAAAAVRPATITQPGAGLI